MPSPSNTAPVHVSRETKQEHRKNPRKTGHDEKIFIHLAPRPAAASKKQAKKQSPKNRAIVAFLG
jgi:hypothetical protein